MGRFKAGLVGRGDTERLKGWGIRACVIFGTKKEKKNGRKEGLDKFCVVGSS